MDFQTAVRTCLKKYATFSDRAARAEFWYFALFGLLVNIAASIFDSAVFGGASAQPITALASLALLLP